MIRFHRPALTLAVAAGLLLTGAGHASAAPAPSAVTPVISIAPLAGTLADSGLEPRREDSKRSIRSTQTAEEALAEQRKDIKTHVYRPPAPGFSVLAYPGEDWITRDECLTKWISGFRGPWHYKNHYSACHVFRLTVTYRHCNPTCGPPLGGTTARTVIIGRGLHTARNLDWDVYFDDWTPWGGIARGDPPQRGHQLHQLRR